jgi:lipopolysaccharide export system permease protein
MAAFLLQEGVFTAVSDDLTVYVRSRDPDGTLHGILVDDGRDKAAHATILAERGRLIEGPAGPRVLLLSGSREEIDHQTGRLNVLTFAQNEMDLADSSRNEGERLRDMSELPLGELLDPHPPNLRDIPKWIAEGHKRLSNPLTAMSYAFVALLSVLSGAFRRHGGYVRPLVAVGAMVLMLALGLAFENLAARNNAMLPLVWIQAVTPGIVCGWLLLGPELWQFLPSRRQAVQVT